MTKQDLVILGLGALLTGCATKVGTMGQGAQDAVWVCHGNRNPRWQKVAAPAARGHQQHGDKVSTTPQQEGAACEN